MKKKFSAVLGFSGSITSPHTAVFHEQDIEYTLTEGESLWEARLESDGTIITGTTAEEAEQALCEFVNKRLSGEGP